MAGRLVGIRLAALLVSRNSMTQHLAGRRETSGLWKIGPTMLRIMTQPGDVTPRHNHAAQAEALYILEGELIDEGTAYSAGTELNVKSNLHHGPHEAKIGVTFLADVHRQGRSARLQAFQGRRMRRRQ